MTKRPSLTQRAVWALTGCAALFVVLLCAVFYLAFEQMEDDLVNAVLTTEAHHMMEQVRQGLPVPKEQSQTELGAMLQSWLITDPADEALLPLPLRGIGVGSHTLKPQDKTWHVVVADTSAGRLYMRYDATAHEARVYEFGWVVLVLGVLCILAAYVLARWLAGLVAGPLLALTDHLSDWAPGAPDMSVRRDDEFGRLIEAFNRLQDRVESSLTFERQFASNLSHEVRTSLAAIRSDSEMLLLEGGLDASGRQRLERMARHIDLMAGSLSSAETLAHDQDNDPRPVQVRACVDEAWLGMEDEADRKGLAFVNGIADDMVCKLDPHALLTVARNLIRNAVEHAAPATLHVYNAGPRSIAFADNGPGIPAGLLPMLFERYFTARRQDTGQVDGEPGPEPSRHGLGLAIAYQMCRRKQWRLEVRSRHGGADAGTIFTLTLDQEDQA